MEVCRKVCYSTTDADLALILTGGITEQSHAQKQKKYLLNSPNQKVVLHFMLSIFYYASLHRVSIVWAPLTHTYHFLQCNIGAFIID